MVAATFKVYEVLQIVVADGPLYEKDFLVEIVLFCELALL